MIRLAEFCLGLLMVLIAAYGMGILP